MEGGVTTAPHGLIVGEEAHIVAEADDGPRGNDEMPKSERNSYANIILLCPTHHTFIDKEEGVHYSVEFLREMKRNHEALVRSGKARTDQSVTRENLLSLADEWAARAGLDEWSDWTSWLLGVQPAIEIEQFRKLRLMGEWLLARHWPDSHSGVKKAMTNFFRVYADFNLYMSTIGHARDGRLVVRQYQQEVEDWDPPKYEAARRRFDEESRVIAELVLELSRAANYVCDVVRSELDEQFRLVQGKLLVSVPEGLGYITRAPEYSSDQRAAVMPYPGLKQFGKDRESRDFHFPGPGRFEHLQRMHD